MLNGQWEQINELKNGELTMSKIAEQKALEEYPIDIVPDEDTLGFTKSDRNEVSRLGYIKGYDQAIQDKNESDSLLLEEYKSRCNLYEELIKYLRDIT